MSATPWRKDTTILTSLGIGLVVPLILQLVLRIPQPLADQVIVCIGLGLPGWHPIVSRLWIGADPLDQVVSARLLQDRVGKVPFIRRGRLLLGTRLLLRQLWGTDALPLAGGRGRRGRGSVGRRS